jgi:hypothetical protein
MMTRKDYVAIARILNNYLLEYNMESRPSFVAEFDDSLVSPFIDLLALDNPNFDKERFWEACFND